MVGTIRCGYETIILMFILALHVHYVYTQLFVAKLKIRWRGWLQISKRYNSKSSSLSNISSDCLGRLSGLIDRKLGADD